MACCFSDFLLSALVRFLGWLFCIVHELAQLVAVDLVVSNLLLKFRDWTRLGDHVFFVIFVKLRIIRINLSLTTPKARIVSPAIGNKIRL